MKAQNMSESDWEQALVAEMNHLKLRQNIESERASV
jgi:hypothetical protein